MIFLGWYGQTVRIDSRKGITEGSVDGLPVLFKNGSLVAIPDHEFDRYYAIYPKGQPYDFNLAAQIPVRPVMLND